MTHQVAASAAFREGDLTGQQRAASFCSFLPVRQSLERQREPVLLVSGSLMVCEE